MLSSALQQSINAASLPHVQAMIRELGRHGLAVTVPHTHENGAKTLPQGMVQVEKGLSVSFESARAVDHATEFPVTWRYNPAAEQIEVCAICSFCK